MITGFPPYNAVDAVSLAREQRANRTEDLVSRCEEIPTLARPLLISALSYDPCLRPSDVEAFGVRMGEALRAGPPNWGARLRLRIARDWTAAGAALVIALVLTVGLTVLTGFLWEGSHIQRVVEYAGGADPVTEGFAPYNDVSATTGLSADGTALESWSIRSRSQGHYLHRLNWWQKRLALQNGWKLTATVRLRKGQFSTIVDFAGLGARFFEGAALEGPKLMAQTWNKQVPKFEYRDAEVVGDSHGYHTYELTYDPQAKSAVLKVDGVAEILGYVGLHQFQSNFGVSFGVELWKSGEGQADFKLVRFEILPHR
jgi:hypothetical protein